MWRDVVHAYPHEKTEWFCIYLVILRIFIPGSGMATKTSQAGWWQLHGGAAKGIHLEDAQVGPGRARIRTRRP